MFSCAGRKRSRPDDSAQRRRDGHQLDFLAALRVIENLGTDRPTNHDNQFCHDTPLLYVLNFISLMVEADTSRGHSDIAVAVAANPGHLQLLMAKPNGITPTHAECENLACFMQAMRDSLENDGRNENLVIKRFGKLIAQRHLPKLSRKISRIGNVCGQSPKRTWERFSSLLPLWHRANPKGEKSHGFVELARQMSGLVHGDVNGDSVMVDAVRSFILHDESRPVDKMNPQERFYFTELALESSVHLVNSSFFGDVISKGPFHSMLNEDDEVFLMGTDNADHIFLYELYRRISDVARYLQGLQHFVQEGIPYIIQVLGNDGLQKFLSKTGGITPHWIIRGRRNIPRTLYWGTSPEEKIQRLLRSNRLALDELEDEEYDRMAQEATVTSLWSKGSPITPVLHPEIQLIQHLERENFAILDWAIGMNQPPCWACFMYLRLLRRFQDPEQKWQMSPTTGRPRGSWMIPPTCHPSLRDSLLCRAERRVYSAVEEYGFDWAEPWAHG
ncbi:hypothetical protein H0H93_014710 [Arthromyces matolae]|nr:hypothetical protein H0H93_014710 [Arthromyces matolae]